MLQVALDVRQRVEQEVRLDLRLEQRQFGLGQRAGELVHLVGDAPDLAVRGRGLAPQHVPAVDEHREAADVQAPLPERTRVDDAADEQRHAEAIEIEDVHDPCTRLDHHGPDQQARQPRRDAARHQHRIQPGATEPHHDARDLVVHETQRLQAPAPGFDAFGQPQEHGHERHQAPRRDGVAEQDRSQAVDGDFLHGERIKGGSKRTRGEDPLGHRTRERCEPRQTGAAAAPAGPRHAISGGWRQGASAAQNV